MILRACSLSSSIPTTTMDISHPSLQEETPALSRTAAGGDSMASLGDYKPQSDHLAFIFFTISGSSSMGIGFSFHSKGIVASMMIREVISLESRGSDGSRGVDLPRLMNWDRFGWNLKLSAQGTRGRSQGSISSSTTMTVFSP